QGPALHHAGGLARPPQRADRDVPRGRGAGALDRADPVVHRRRTVALPSGTGRGPARRQRPVRDPLRGTFADAGRRGVVARRLRPPAGTARAGRQGAGTDARQRRDRCGARCRNQLARRCRLRCVAGAVRGRTAVPVDQRGCDCGGGWRGEGDRGFRRSHREAEVHPVLAASGGCRDASGASGNLRSLRVQHRRAGRDPEVVLMAGAPKRNALPWLALSALVLVLDQWSKAWVLSSLPEYQPIPVIEGFWNWFRTYNTGAAFSFLSDASGWQQYLFI